MAQINSHVTQNFFWLFVFAVVFLILLFGSIFKRSRLNGWGLSAVIFLMLSDLCAMSRKILLVFMYKKLESLPEKGLEMMARMQSPQLTLLRFSGLFLLGAFVMYFFRLKQKNPKQPK